MRFRSHPVWQREQQFRMRSPGSSPEAQVIQSHLSFCIATAATAPPALVRAQRMPSAQPDSVPTLLLACREFGGEFSASRSPEAIELGRIDVTCKVCSNFSSACLFDISGADLSQILSCARSAGCFCEERFVDQTASDQILEPLLPS